MRSLAAATLWIVGVWSALCVLPATAAGEEPLDQLPAWTFYVPNDAELATLLPELGEPEVLRTRSERLNGAQAAASSQAERALITFVRERLLWGADVAVAVRARRTGERVEVPAPSHPISAALLRTAMDGADEAYAKQARLALGFILAESGDAAGRAEGKRLLEDAYDAWVDPDVVAAIALRLDELAPSVAMGPPLGELAKSRWYDALVAYRRAVAAGEKGTAFIVEQRYRALFKVLAAHDQLDGLASSLATRCMRELVEAASQSDDGWARVSASLELFTNEQVERWLSEALPEIDRVGTAANRAGLRIMLAGKVTDPTRGVVLLQEAVGAVADAEAFETCRAAFATAEAQGWAARAELEVAARACVRAATARGLTESAGSLELFEVLYQHHPTAFAPDARAVYGLALMRGGQLTFAAEQLFEVDVLTLAPAARAGFASSALELAFRLNPDLRLARASCLPEAPRTLQGRDGRFAGWLAAASAEPAFVRDPMLQELHVVEALLRADYGQATARALAFARVSGSAGPADKSSDSMRSVDVLDGLTECLLRGRRWRTVTTLTSELRGVLSEEASERYFGRWGDELVGAHTAYAAAAREMGQLDEALRALLALQTGWRRHPRQPEVLFAIAELQRATGRAQDSISTYEALVEQEPDGELADDALFAMGELFMELGDPVAAREILARVVAEHAYGTFSERAQGLIEGISGATP